MGRIIKKIVSVVLALAMVVTGINYTPKTVKADDYTLVEGNFDSSYAYEITYNNLTGFVRLYFYGDSTTTYMQVIGSEDSGIANPDITINGSAPTEGIVTEKSAAVVGFMMSKLEDNANYEFSVSGTGGTIEFVVRKGTPATTGETETTTQETTDETTASSAEPATIAETEEDTEAETIALDWLTDATLTAGCGEGAQYAYTGSVPDGNMEIQAEQLYWLSGATKKSIKITLNGTTKVEYTENSAAGVPFEYSELSTGINTIVVEETDSEGTLYTYTYYVKVPLTTTNLSINDYVSHTGKYIVKFDNVDGAVSYNVYIDGATSNITLGGSGDYIAYDELTSYTTGEHTVQLTAVYEDGTETNKSKSVKINKPEAKGHLDENESEYVTDDDVAQIYVQTDDTSIDALTGMTKTKVTASITVIDQNGTYDDVYDDAAKTTIKVRGNSTAGAAKKAFNIAFSSKQNLLGLSGEGKSGATKWSLLANAFDKTLIRNKIAMDFGTDIMGIPYNSNSRFVDLYLNGRYMGNYLLIESVETGDSRIEIDAENAESNDILLELDSNGRDVATDEHLSERTSLGIFFAVNSPEADPSNEKKHTEYQTKYETKLSNALTYLNNFETALQEEDNWNDIEEMIDVNTFVDFYLVSELFKNQDIAFSSTRFYIKDNKLYAGPMWDYDLSSGNLWTTANGGNEYSETDRSAKGYKATTFKWFELLMKKSEFKTLVVERYRKLRSTIQDIYAENGTIDTLINEIQGSITRNYTSVDEGGAGWSATTKDSGDSYSYAAGPGWKSYDEAISYYKSWLSTRVAFLSEEWLGEEKPETAPAYSSVEVKDSDWTQITTNIADVSGTPANKKTWYCVQSAYDAVKGTSRYMQFADNGAALTHGGGTNNTITGPVFAFSAKDDGNIASVWINGTKLSVGENYYRNSDVICLAQSLFEDGKTTYVTVRYADGTDYIVPIKAVREYNYAPTGFAASILATTATVTWTETDDAKEDNGITYELTLDGTTQTFTSAQSVTFDFTNKEYDVYEVKLVTYKDGVKVDSQTTELSYLEQDAPDLTTVRQNTPALTATASWTSPSGANDGSSVNTANTLRFSIATNYYAGGDYNNGFFGSLWGIFSSGKTMPYAGGDANTISGEVLGLSSEKIRSGISSVWIDGVKLKTTTATAAAIDDDDETTAVVDDDYCWSPSYTDILSIATSNLTLDDDEDATVHYITVRTADETDYTFPIKVERIATETTTEETTEETTTTATVSNDAIEPLPDNDVPTDAEWTQIGTTEYWYYIPSKAAGYAVNFNPESANLYIGYTGVAAAGASQGTSGRFKSVTINETNIDNSASDGAFIRIDYNYISAYGVYKVDIVDINNQIVTTYIKKGKVMNYKVQGLTATASGTDKTATIQWTESDDAKEAGCTYSVAIEGVDDEKITLNGDSATCDLSELEYGTYTVTVSTVDTNGKVVATNTTTFRYRDPDAIDCDFDVDEQWGLYKTETLTWTEAAENATGYAIYVDGVLYDTTTELSYVLPAYAFAYANKDTLNAAGQPTTVGTHTVKVVALLNGEDAPAYKDIDENHIIGENTTTLYKNYISANDKNLWNKEGITSPWNFVVCEDKTDTDINVGSSIYVDYDTDGAALLKIYSTGEHAGSDQAWTIKAAIYDEEATKGELVNVSFDIKGPASLIGQTIKIKCIAEEWDETENTYAGNPYIEELFTFVSDGNGGAVLHFSDSFTSTGDTYDVLFGLGLLTFSGDELDLSLSAVDTTKVYGVKDVTPSAVLNTSDIANNGILVNWTSDVPSHLTDEYEYKVFIDGKEVTVEDGQKITSGLTYQGYGVGEHTVVVKSYYDGTETSSVSSKVNIEQINKPDIVITKMSIPSGEYHIGDTVPVSVTVKNIGTVAATPASGSNLTINFYSVNANRETGVAERWLGYKTLAGVVENQTLNPDAEATVTFDYTITAGDNKGGYLFDIKALADADGKIDEISEDNNTYTSVFKFYAPIENLALTNDGKNIVASWSEHDSTTKNFTISYVDATTGETVSVETTGNVKSYTFPEGTLIANNTTVTVTANHSDGSSHTYAQGTALADLVIDSISLDGTAYIGKAVNVVSVVKNIGVAVATSTAADNQILSVILSNGVYTTTSTVLNPNDTVELSISYTPASSETETVTATVDDAHRITESDETNNTATIDINAVEKTYNTKMDWEPLVSNADDETNGKTYSFTLGGSSQKGHIYYKILDTSIKGKDYIDIITTRVGYSGSHMSIHASGETLIDRYGSGDNLTTDTVISMALASSEADFDKAEYEQITLQNLTYVGKNPENPDEKITIEKAQAGSNMDAVADGFQYNAVNFGLYKYYLMKLQRANGEYITIAFKVTDEDDKMGTWIKAAANLGNDATDTEKLPFYYHDTNYETTGCFKYLADDLGLSSISCYNGNYLAVHISDTVNIGDSYKIEMAYASVDASGAFVKPTDEDAFKTVPVYNKEGNTLQLQLPALMQEFPVHSDLGGQKDSEYYFMKVYYDTENYPDKYVEIPVMVKADIPMITGVQGLTAVHRGSSLTVAWTNTAAQDSLGYLYDVYIDGEKVSENVRADSYTYSGYSTVGETHKIKVVAKWCEQTAEEVLEYTIKDPDEEPEETIDSDITTFPDDDSTHQWVLINGQNILPIRNGGTATTVNAQIYYYTDDDIKTVVGYNGYYISLCGSTKYFTGTSSKLYVKAGDSTTFESKSVYDNYYEGGILMQAEKMFATYGEWKNGDTLYYTVRIAGDNGNTYKDFYFKVVPTDESYSDRDSGGWRNISGEYKLPVQVGNSSKLLGTISYYDYPSKTGTYDIVGYNGYYMSIMGNTNYYAGESTHIYVSDASETELTVDKTDGINFTEKTILEKTWEGVIIIRSADTFTAKYGTSYYLLKVVNGDNVAYVPVKVEVDTGNVEVLGFQINTNNSTGGIAEYNPSFRVVSRTSNVMSINGELHEVKKMGTIYGLTKNLDSESLATDMTLDGAENNEYVRKVEATSRGKLVGYTTNESDSEYNTYYALSFEYLGYIYSSLQTDYAFRAYAVLDDGTTVYGSKVYSTNMYEIAQNLYENQKMSSETAHEYLYNNILNVVKIYTNRSQISNAMLKALGIKDKTDTRYGLINTAYKNMYSYVMCNNGYTYSDRGEFKCSDESVEEELLEKLNSATSTAYTSLSQWIYNETSNYSNSAGTYQGYYRTVEYAWDNSIDREFDTE